MRDLCWSSTEHHANSTAPLRSLSFAEFAAANGVPAYASDVVCAAHRAVVTDTARRTPGTASAPPRSEQSSDRVRSAESLGPACRGRIVTACVPKVFQQPAEELQTPSHPINRRIEALPAALGIPQEISYPPANAPVWHSVALPPAWHCLALPAVWRYQEPRPECPVWHCLALPAVWRCQAPRSMRKPCHPE